MSQIESIIERAKGVIISPQKEWEIISIEEKTTASVLRSYLLPLSVIMVIACYIGYGIVGSDQGMFGPIATAELGYRHAAFNFFTIVIATFITPLVISFLASFFSTKINFNRAYRLVVYSYTPTLIASILFIIPALSPLVLLAGVYGLYLLYLGFKPMTKVPDDKMKAYFITSLLTTIVIYLFISILMTPILLH